MQFILSAILICQYYLILRNKKQYTKNRIYLLTTLLFSILIPFISFQVFPYEVIAHKSSTVPEVKTPNINGSIDFLTNIYIIGCLCQCSFFLYELVKIIIEIKKTSFKKVNNYFTTYNNQESYSFFQYAFLKNENTIFQYHEEGHIRLLHSWDRIVLAIVKILFWYNPFIYLYRNFIIENHEYAADAYAIKKLNVSPYDYGQMLYSYASEMQGTSSLSNRFNSLIKNRIIMLSQINSKKSVSYLLTLPVLFILFAATTFKKYPMSAAPNSKNNFSVLDTFKQDSIFVTDTIVTYDNDTKKEQMLIVRSKKAVIQESLVPNEILNLKLSGKMYEVIDTISMYDTETLKETTKITKYELPIEIVSKLGNLKPNEWNAVMEKYAVYKKK